jgi:hypothetical protein
LGDRYLVRTNADPKEKQMAVAGRFGNAFFIGRSKSGRPMRVAEKTS